MMDDEQPDRRPKAAHHGEIRLGGWVLPVRVLDDGTRVFSERGMMSILDVRGRGSRHGHRIRAIFDVPYLKPLFSPESWMDIERPVLYLDGGKPAVGYRSTVLGDMIKALVQAARSGALTSAAQQRYFRNAEVLRDALVNVALDALIDEATGYQEIRDRHALQALLDRYLRRAFADWAKRFPDDFYDQIFRLKGWRLDGVSTLKRPGIIGRYTRDIVYERLAPGLLAELERLNPSIAGRGRRQRHHQWLTEEIGHPALRDHLIGVVAIMRGSSSWAAFRRSLKQSFPKTGDQTELDLC